MKQHLVAILIFASLIGCVSCKRSTSEHDRFYHAWAFREIAVRNYAEALQLFANKNAREKFAEMNKNLWSATDPAQGWAFFFDGAVLYPAGGSEKIAPVAFYHSFADVFLVLTYEEDFENKSIINDAFILAGDFVRKQGKTPFKAVRHWTEQEVFAPYAVGLSAAATIKAFEKLFPGDQNFLFNFNKIVSADLNEANQVSAGVQLMETLSDLSELLSPDKKTDISALVWKKLVKINDQVLGGEIKRILNEADKTPSEHQKALKNMEIKEWRNLKLSAYVESENFGMVMLQSSANPDTYLSLLMKKHGNAMRLSRMDFLSFNKFYEQNKNIK